MDEQKKEIPLLIYALTAIAFFATGLIYLFPAQFISCKEGITSRNWSELGPSLQMLPLTLMKGIGATLVGVGVATYFLRRYPFSKKCLYLSLPVTQLILFVSLMYINIHVIETVGSISWYIFLLNGLLIVITCTLSIYYPHKSIGSGCSI